MKYKKPLNQIKALLSLEVKLEQMKLEDGVTTVEAEAFEADYSIGVVTETGIVPMPVGEYTTQDGKVITVAQEGIIATVSDGTTEPAPEEVTDPEMTQEPAQPTKVVETVSKETFFAKEQELAEANAKIVELTTQLAEATKAPVELEAEPEQLTYNPESGTEVKLTKMASRSPQTTTHKIFDKLYNKN